MKNLASNLLLWLCLLGGSAAPVHASELDAWVEAQLLPYLSDRLGRHPRLKGVPTEVVVLKDNRVAAKMNGLAAQLRQRIIDHLQAAEGVNLHLPAPLKSWDRHTTLYGLPCRQRLPRAQVALRLRQAGSDDRVRVEVQAIDLIENDWIAGFKKVWTGRLEASEQAQMRRQVTDMSRLGVRELPFTDGQADLLAAELALRAGCRLQAGESRQPQLHVAALTQAQARLQPVRTLLQQHLERLPEVRIAAGDEAADLVLEMNTQNLEGDLHQLWLEVQGDSPQPRHSGYPSLQQPLYVELRPTGLQPAAQSPPQAGSRSAAQSPVRAGIPLQAAEPAPAAAPEPEPLIRRFGLWVPQRQGACEHARPWDGGARRLEAGASLASGACFGLRLEAAQSFSLYLLSQGPEGRWQRLLPNNCNVLGLGRLGARIEAGQVLELPLRSDGSRGLFRLDQRTGRERIYAIAIADAGVESALFRRLRHRVADPCRLRSGAALGGLALEAELERLAQASPAKLQWRSISFQHVEAE